MAPALLLGAAGLGAEVEPPDGAVLPAGQEGVRLPGDGHHLRETFGIYPGFIDHSAEHANLNPAEIDLDKR